MTKRKNETQEQYLARKRAYNTAHAEEIAARQQAYRAAHSTELRAKKHAYNAAHREELRAKARDYRATNPEKAAAADKAYYAAHRQEELRKDKEYKAAHRDEIAERERAYQVTHREEYITHQHTYRARRNGGSGTHTVSEWRELCHWFGNVCVCCGKHRQLSRDHVVPITLGGSNDIANIQPLCKVCNSKKYQNSTDYRDPALLAQFLGRQSAPIGNGPIGPIDPPSNPNED